jgi:transaldolase
MQFFIDTADLNAIERLHDIGLVDGVTTNPSLIAKQGGDFKKTIQEICKIVQGPVSAEVIATDHATMLKEALHLSELDEHVVIKLPLTLDGLKTCSHLSKRQIPTNVTLCFSATQALLAAKVGATYISPFIGRLDDIGLDGMGLIEEIRAIYDQYPELETKILAASIRTVNHVRQAAMIGADVATIPPEIVDKLAAHPLTDKGLDAFLKDWAGTGQTIL